MHNQCVRCGGCCLKYPCFSISIDEEKFVEIDSTRLHICKHFKFEIDKQTTICDIYQTFKHKNVNCTSRFKQMKKDCYQNLINYYVKNINKIEDLR